MLSMKVIKSTRTNFFLSSSGKPREIFNDLFDVTFTYRQDSTVFNGFGKIKPKSREAQEAYDRGEWLSYDNTTAVIYKAERSKDIAWMVSHCKTESKREQIVSHLREVNENLNIDIFGKCGDKEHKLPGQTTNDIAQTMKMRADLYVDKLKDYKFYLSFENALCQDCKNFEYCMLHYVFIVNFSLLFSLFRYH